MFSSSNWLHFFLGLFPSQEEHESLVKAGWELEGIAFHSADSSEGVPVYRLYNPNASKVASHIESGSRGFASGWMEV